MAVKLLTKHQRLNNHFHTGEKLISAPYPAGHLSRKARWENVQLNAEVRKNRARDALPQILAWSANSRALQKVVGEEQRFGSACEKHLFLRSLAMNHTESNTHSLAPACDLEHAACGSGALVPSKSEIFICSSITPRQWLSRTLLLRVHNRSRFIDDVTRAVNKSKSGSYCWLDFFGDMWVLLEYSK